MSDVLIVTIWLGMAYIILRNAAAISNLISTFSSMWYGALSQITG